MKLITSPKTVAVKINKDQDPKEISFKEFLTMHLDSYSMVKTPGQVRQIGKIWDVVEASNGHVSLEDADYEVLKGAVNEVKYIPAVSRQLISYWDAVEKAEDVKK